MIQSRPTDKHYDTAIIGAGILGLWAARHASKRGEKVLVLEKRKIGEGASGGFLGALMPHMPDVWNEKKQLQYDGLMSIGEAINELESDTGLDCGFRRCGRVIPLSGQGVLQQVEKRSRGADLNWCAEFELMLLQGADLSKTGASAWVKPQGTFLGVQFDTFSARVNPRAYLKALEKYAKAHCEVCEGVGVASIEFNEGSLSPRIALESGEYVTATKVAVANGWEAYPLLQAYLGQLNEQKPIGRGVKGQAVLLEHQHDDDLAIVYSDGVYVVPHAGNRVAVGSTSENEWSGKPNAFDEDNMEFYERAISLVPDLAQAPIVARWAGVRPRNTIKGRGTTPWLGPVADHEHLHALIGGFKITLGIAHLDYLSGAHSI